MGATEMFETLVVIRAIDAFTAPARRMAEQMGLVGAQAEALQQKLKGFKNMAMAGGAMTLVGVGMAKGLLSAADAAGDLQTAIMGVKTALGLNNDEFQKAMNMSQTMGIPTIFNAQQVGGIMATAANAGLTKSAVLDPAIMQQYVNFADVQAQGTKKEDPNSVIASAVKMTNLSQISGTKDTSAYLDQLNAALMHTTDTAAQFATNYKYYIGKAQLMGVSSSDALVDNAWLSRMGLGGGRGGMAMQDFLSRSIYGSSGKKADAAMQAAGFVQNGRSVFEDAKGAFVGIPAASKILQDFGQRFHGDAALMSPLLQSIFGTAGQKVAIAMSTSASTTQYANVKEQMQSTTPVNDAQAAYNEKWQGQEKQMATVLQDIWTNFGLGVSSSLLPLLTELNDFLTGILKWEQAHPEVMKWVATFTEIAAAVLLVVGPITLLVGVFGYLSTANMFTTGFKLLGAAIGGAAGPVLGLLAAGYLLYQAWTNDWGGIREKTKAVTDWLAQEIPKAVKSVKDFAKDLGLISQDGKFDMPAWLKYLLIGLASARTAVLILTAAQTAYNLVCDTNPWVAALSIISLGILALAANWDTVTASYQRTMAAMGKTGEQNYEDAYGTKPTSVWDYLKYANQLRAGIPINKATVNSTADSMKAIRGYAAGTNYSSAGLAWVGEHGPELLNLPGGSQITPNHKLGDLVPSKGDTHNHFAPGSVVVHAAPGQSPDEIADAVMKKLGTKTRTYNLSRSMGANRLVF